MSKAMSTWMAALVLGAGLGCGGTTTKEVPAPRVVVTGSVAVEVGATITLQAVTENASDSGYAWTSSDEAVATVDATGTVTGVAEGVAIITATGVDTKASGSWGVHVWRTSEVPVPEPSVVVGGPVAVQVGESITLQAQTLDGQDSGYDWTSSDTAIATVDAQGTVTGVAPGEAVITATGKDTGKSGTWGVHVFEEAEPPPPQPRVTVEGGLSVTVGGTLQLTAKTEDGVDSGYTWTSSDEAVAQVDAGGKVTGLSAGEAIITATGQDTGASGAHGVVVVPPDIQVPFEELWSQSGHADTTAEAFRHWDASGTIPTGCAKCHSTPGYLDFLGADGSAEGVVDQEVPVGTVITCQACHNAKTLAMDEVTFPSGAVVSGLGAEARCMQCHQGRESTVSVDQAIADAAPADDDEVPVDAEGKPLLRFKNIHYFAAGATLYGGVVKGGYQYAGQSYDVKFQHVPGVDTCLSCHDPHTLEVRIETCQACHAGVESTEDLKNVRMFGSVKDYDGDGDTGEGIYFELEGVRERLYAALRLYAKEVLGVGIAYDPAAYPYFFEDADGNGQPDVDGEGNSIAYTQWSARLLRAAYNFQYAQKDPGAFAHNAKYVIELMYDSIMDLAQAIAVDVAGLHRIDAGHFAGSEEAWRHWDEDGAVSASCSRCHSAGGLRFYVQTGTTQEEPTTNGMLCATCHPDVPDFANQIAVKSATFPSGAVVDTGDNTSNLCITCHQGRESKVSVDAKIAASGAVDEDTVPKDAQGKPALGFLNVHYFAAGATLFGTQAKGAYEYDGKAYDGKFSHVAAFLNCKDCHGVHSQEVKVSLCGDCHAGVVTLEDLKDVRMAGSIQDYDGDGDASEGIWHEIDGLRARLLQALQAYATQVIGTGVVYDGHAYPYFFKDTDGDGVADADEVTYGNRFVDFTPRLLKAAYNYQYAQKDPGAFAHNAKYVIAVLYDSIESLAQRVTVDMTGLHRNDVGHFDGTAEAWRHWDEDGAVSASCARCHSPSGFQVYLDTGANPTDAQPISWGLTCETCHTGSDFADGAPLHVVASVTFPSGVTIQNTADDPSFLCMTCHQGRESKATIDAAIAAGQLSFKNVHYLSAGATLYGHDAQVGYEYDGKTYQGKFEHFGGESARCAYCHEVTGERHAFEPQVTSTCTACHTEATVGDVHSIRKSRPLDYDGDGNNQEPLMDEVAGLAALLLARIQAVASANGQPIAYSAGAYPYFFDDANGNGVADPGEGKYTAWTPGLMKAAHNYQISQKEPGAWAHNTDYAAQLLIDAIADLGGDVSGLDRP